MQIYSTPDVIPMNFEIDEDSISEHSSDPEGLELEKNNIDVKNLNCIDYKNLMQEAYTAHFAMLEEKDACKNQAAKYGIETTKSEIEEIKQKWMNDEADDDCHITIIANDRNVNSDIFLSHNKAFINYIDGKTVIEIRTLKVKSIGDIESLNNCIKWVMYQLGKDPRSMYSPENNLELSLELRISTIEILDLSCCKGIDMKALSKNAPIFKCLTSFILQRCNLKEDHTDSLVSLFEKTPSLIFLDIKHNSFDLLKILEALHTLPELGYLLVDGNPKPKNFLEEVKKLDIHI
ncbi:unnamed protein product [Moneuplotes crassus]|uniref:KA1 domain-containing protein n=2 Tax=Euplotes crassus TaxID=5936 RepID=A0AAD2CWI3_EUPCR|nr:unnamed protein product [Moneuplotes crassus]